MVQMALINFLGSRLYKLKLFGIVKL